ncbi:MAG TPA: BolA family transcriptional regulator [Kiloniellaceae bacterium]|nr:BolA family transcriptional regulator [Kiloniellaceae bacterium]
MAVAETIERKLTAALEPQRLRIVDDSEKHKGHAGYREGGETHFRVEVVSENFAGLSRVARQRKVYEILQAEIDAGLHALQLKTLTPAEDAANPGRRRREG